jgi:hypothetical protein
VFGALAEIGGTPVKINAGNERKLPPRLMEFIVLANKAARKSRIARGRVISRNSRVKS